MSTISLTKLERGHLLRKLLDFTEDLPARIERLVPSSDTAVIIFELRSHINTLSSHSSALSSLDSTAAEDVDAKATAIWNQATRLKREVDEANKADVPHAKTSVSKEKPPLVATVRTFAFLLLDAASRTQRNLSSKRQSKPSSKQTWSDNIRLLRVANKSAKSCIEYSQAEYCTKILERGADYIEALRKIANATESVAEPLGSDEELKIYMALKTEFYALRMTLAWKQDNLEVAEMMFRHATQTDIPALQPQSAEMLSDCVFELGKDLFQKKDYYMASKWLEKAYDVISCHELDRMSFEAEDLKFTIMHYLVSALLEMNTDADRTKANNFIALLEHGFAGKMAVPLLRFEYMRKDKQYDTTQFSNVLNQVIRMMHITETNFNMVMNCVHDLKEHSPEMACRALDDLLNLRLFSQPKEELIHRVFITRVWVTVDKLPTSSSTIESLSHVVESLGINLAGPLEETVTHAAQVLLWKRIELLYQQEDFQSSESWCRLSLHRVFGKAGKLNIAKISRKLLLCNLGASNYPGARSAFNQMEDDIKSEPLTRHIMYKVAIRDKDATLAAECLDVLARSKLDNHSLLYACVIEAQLACDKEQAILALKAVLSSNEEAKANNVHFPSLLRCIARLLTSGLSKGQGEESSDVAQEIIKVFEAATRAIEKRKHTPKNTALDLFTDSELEWFAKSSYNIALKKYMEWQPDNVIKLLECCTTFLKSLSKNGSSSQTDLLALVCHGLAAQQNLRLARLEENLDLMTNYYRQVRTHVIQFQECAALHSTVQTDATNEIRGKMWKKLLLNDFESAIRLEDWDDLNRILDEWNRLDELEGLEVFADMVMGSNAPLPILFQTLNHISYITASRMQANTAQQARWLRILYQLSLNPGTTNPRQSKGTTAKAQVLETDEIIARTIEVARAARSQPQQRQPCSASATSTGYPVEELEYVATTTYNRAVDAYCASDEIECRRLGEQALLIAEELAPCDGGALRRVLVKRLGELLGVRSGT